MNFTKHRLLFLFHFMVQHNIQHLRLLEFSMARSPNRFLCFLLAHHKHIVDLSSSYFDLSYMCAQSRLVFQSPWPMSQRERISHLVYDFDASSIVWSFDAIEMADWWFKDGWRRWLKGGHSSTFKWGVAILHINNITPKICRTSRAWLVIRIIKLSTGLFDCQFLNRSKVSLEISMRTWFWPMHTWTTREMQ